jgi:hypothetical protein
MSKPQTNGGETDSGTDLTIADGSGQRSSFYADAELGQLSSRVKTGSVVVSVSAPADATALEIALALDRAEGVTTRSLTDGGERP